MWTEFDAWKAVLRGVVTKCARHQRNNAALLAYFAKASLTLEEAASEESTRVHVKTLHTVF